MMSNLGTVQIAWLALGAGGVSVIAVILAGIAVARANGWKRRYLRVFDDSSQTVEELVIKAQADAKMAVSNVDKILERIASLEQKQEYNFDKLGLVRFNPFDDTGADLSFAMSILNDRGDGVVLTSLWGRDEVRVYAKPVQENESRYALSQEEKQALGLAASVRQGLRTETVGKRQRNK
ncbi:MAG: DUF4446 family protein [Sulfobacillus sp.]